ncbi:sensor histidine kinase [Paenibacillus athensensis]|uniref:HAMP domain-containing protein n=1 Tax=Paenibacillus athensensis TaxID=1967502 RepID=A0A4Y8Q0A7_9BACL|nr:sensor histidine kinase [Paenibacillus athensensis]MCD1261161.1 sensor histidine kinase [Paenibacillus athensensis]
MKPLAAWYYNLPLLRKLLLWFVPLLIGTIMTTGFFAYTTAVNEIMTKTGLEQEGIATQAVDHLDYIAQDALNITDYIFLTPEIQQLLNSDSQTYVSSREVVDSINRLMVTRPYFQFLTMYSAHFQTMQFNNKGLSSAIPFEEYSERFHYDGILANPKIANWSIELPNRSNSIFHGDNMNKLLLTKVLKSYTNMKPEGVLILGIDERDIRASYSPFLGQTEIVVFQDDGTVLSDSGGRWIGHSITELPYWVAGHKPGEAVESAVDADKWLYTHIESTVTGWHVLVVQPRAALVEQLNRIKWITSLIVILTLLLSVIVSWIVASVITKPMKHIVISMKKFQKGDFTQQVPVNSRDEIGQLASGYNIMVKRIHELIENVFESEIRQKQSELKVLQSQINPHFLYNTLNTIAWSAEKNKDPLVAEMIYSLSGMFKISLSAGRDVIPLDQELKLAEHYLFLQKMRFPDKLTYEIEVTTDIRDFSVPKLLVQPLVENAVVHGIEPLSGDVGHIHVAVVVPEEGGVLHLEITDNGVGIAEEALEKLREKLRSGEPASSTEQSYALLNIRNRLRLYYGEEAAMEIDSVGGSGTRIRLILPNTWR